MTRPMQIPGRTRLLLLCLAFAVVHSPRAGTVASQYETPPPDTNSFKWEDEQLRAKALQETFRKHIAIPATATAPDISRAGSLYAPAGSIQIVSSAASSPGPGKMQQTFFGLVVLFVAGILLIRKYAPEVLAGLSQRFNPWAAAPHVKRPYLDNVRAEGESFDKFVTTFRVGPVTPAAAPAPVPAPEADLAREFFGAATVLLARQRELLQKIVHEASGLARQKLLEDLRADLFLLKQAAGFPDALPVWQLAGALDGLLKQLTDKMGNVTHSTLRTVVSGVEMLDDLCESGLQKLVLTERPLKFLVVDDDLISRQALSFALSKAFTKPDLASDADAALAKINEFAYDAIFLDVQMPGMDGFELCVKIHGSDLNRHTPVVFVTGLDEFQTRARSTISGGNDLLGKPFLTFEVTVKAFTLGLQGRLRAVAPKVKPGLGLMEPLLQTFAEPVRPEVTPQFFARSAPVMTAAAEEITNEFLTRVVFHIDPLRELCLQMLLASDEAQRQGLLADGFLRISSMISMTGQEIIHPAYQMCIALDGLFRKLLEGPKFSSPAALATLTSAVDMLRELCAPGMPADLASHPPIELMVVDDDLITRRAFTGALQTTFKRPVGVENGEAALALAAERAFDLIFMDVLMPGMDGFEVCAKIRALDLNRDTPVIFVTGLINEEMFGQISGSGGNDLLEKPLLNSEISVKALTYVLGGRLQRLAGKTP